MFTTGQILNDYKIVGPLGQPGGYGRAHKVVNINNSSEAALKECYGNTTDDLKRFDNENDILHVLQTHDYIIKPFSKILTEGSIKYYLMELADESLTDFLNKNYNLSSDEKIELFIKICTGIEHAHSLGVVHRDIWWNNVVMMSHQTPSIPKVTDFGRSRNFSMAQLTSQPPPKWGLPEISQPELYFKHWDSPSQQDYIVGDIYALGVLLYYSLEVGPLPYSFYFVSSIRNYLATKGIDVDSVDEAIRQRAYKDWLKTINYAYLDALRQLSSHGATLVQKVDPIIKKMCDPDFSTRYQSMSELLADLKQI